MDGDRLVTQHRGRDSELRDLEGGREELLAEVERLRLRIRSLEAEGGAPGKAPRRTVMRSGEYYRAVIDSAIDIIMVVDSGGVLKYVNSAVRTILGYEPADLLGRTGFEFIHPEDVPAAADTLREAAARPGYSPLMELRVQHRDGSWRHLEGIGRNLLDHPAVGGFVISFREIGDRKRIERELQERNEELEAFAHTVSHDLLNPVAIVEGYAKAALEADEEGRPEAERECLESIIEGARRMSGLIASLLQYAQAGHAEGGLRRVEPGEVVSEVLDELERDVSARGARVAVAGDLPPVLVDRIKLGQVFSNLISNALRHMGEVREPRVEIAAAAEGGEAVFLVRDNGAGIPPGLQEKIFEPFKHYSEAGVPGLGIGLSTVRRAVRAWGGRIWVESEPGNGTTFFFTAPVA